MAAFLVMIADEDVTRVTQALCSITQVAPTILNATTAMEDLVLRITKDYEDRVRATYVRPPLPPPVISIAPAPVVPVNPPTP